MPNEVYTAVYCTPTKVNLISASTNFPKANDVADQLGVLVHYCKMVNNVIGLLNRREFVPMLIGLFEVALDIRE